MKKTLPFLLCVALLSSCGHKEQASEEGGTRITVTKKSSSEKAVVSSSNSKASDVSDADITNFLKAHSDAVTKSLNAKKNEIASYYDPSSAIYQEMVEEIVSGGISQRTEKSYEVLSIKRESDGRIVADTKSVSDYLYGNGRQASNVTSEFTYTMKQMDGALKIVDRTSKNKTSRGSAEPVTSASGVDLQAIDKGDVSSLEGRCIPQSLWGRVL